MSLTLHTDSPLYRQIDDCFQRYDFAKRIARIVGSPKIKNSLVVGLYGKWGEGKSTVMNFIEQELPAETVTVKFNPWLFSDEQHLLKSFFTAISEAIGTVDKTFLERAGGVLSEYGLGIGLVTSFAGIKGKELSDFGDKLKNTSVEKLKYRVDELILDSGKNIVVFVDDIDRLSIDEVQYVFKLVKLVADFPRTCYILSFDEEMVAAALSPKYGGNRASAGYNFLEKIIQVPLKIPRASKAALSKFTLTLIHKVLDDANVKLSDEELGYFSDIFNSAFVPYIDNPRLGVRYANTLSFSLPILHGEAHMGDLMIVEGLKVFYPHLYDFVRSNSMVFLSRTDISSFHNYDRHENAKKEIQEELDAALQTYDKRRKKAVIDLLSELFPQLKNIYRNSSYGEDYYAAFSREKRICSSTYFDRYFSYSVAEGDIPDRYFDRFLDALSTETIDVIVSRLKDSISRFSPFDLMQKFRLHAETLDELQAKMLANAIARIGHDLPSEENFLFSSEYSWSAIAVRAIIKAIPAAERLKFCMQLFDETPSLDYALELYRWFTVGEKYYENSAPIKEEDFGYLKNLLVNKFTIRMVNGDFFSIVSNGDLVRLLLWWKESTNKTALDQYLEGQLKNSDNPDFAFKLLIAITPTVTQTILGVKGTKVQKANFKKEIYDRIKSIINPELLNGNLVQKYGMIPYEGDPNILTIERALSDVEIVRIFQWYLLDDAQQIQEAP